LWLIPYGGIVGRVSETTYIVNGMTCGHCVAAVRGEVAGVPGVTEVDVDLDTKRVVVRGDGVDDAAVRAAIVEAGYEAA
jgi:copper chaperone CopZ